MDAAAETPTTTEVFYWPRREAKPIRLVDVRELGALPGFFIGRDSSGTTRHSHYSRLSTTPEPPAWLPFAD